MDFEIIMQFSDFLGLGQEAGAGGRGRRQGQEAGAGGRGRRQGQEQEAGTVTVDLRWF